MNRTNSADDRPYFLQRTESAKTTTTTVSSPKGKRRRNRVITSCIECRRRKLKCDKLYPCTNCHKGSRDCVFLASSNSSGQKVKTAEEKTNILKHGEKVARGGQNRRRSSQSGNSSLNYLSDNSSVAEEEKLLEVTPWEATDAVHESESSDDMIDLGLRIGKMRMTERFSGLFRPKISEEAEANLENAELDRRTVEEKATSIIPTLGDNDDYLGAGPTYISPGTGFLFGSEDKQKSLIEFFPTKAIVDLLIDRYFNNVHLVARVVHWPSFQSQHNDFWQALRAGQEPPTSRQALILAIMFSALVSMSQEEVNKTFGRSKCAILKQFQRGVEMSLAKAKFLRTTKIDTLQAFVIYLIPLCYDQISRAHSVLVGTAVRLAECMGLHRDPARRYGLPPVQCQIRRTLWHQLCCLDFRTGEVQGPRPCIKREDYCTEFPVNIDDADLARGTFEESHDHFTDMTLSKIRFECNEMRRTLWYDRMRLEERKISLTYVLGKIESFRKTMEAKYNPILDSDVPIQQYTKICLQLLLMRLHVKILQRYLRNDPNDIVPDRVRQIVLTTGTAQLEAAYELETTPALQKWRWFNGFHQQWHTAFLLLTEIYVHPHRREADRIWKVLNFVFGLDPSQSPALRARIVINAVRERTMVYYERRKMRIPLGMKRKHFEKARRVNSVNFLESQPSSALEQNMSDFSLAKIQSTEQSSSLGYSPWSNVTCPAANMATHLWDSKHTNDGVALSRLDTNQITDWSLEEQKWYSASLPQSPLSGDYFDFGDFGQSKVSSQQSSSQLITTQQASPTSVQQNSPQFPALMSCSRTYEAAFTQENPRYDQFPGVASQNISDKPRTTMVSDVDMLRIDWSEWDKLFPPDQNTGDLDMTPP